MARHLQGWILLCFLLSLPGCEPQGSRDTVASDPHVVTSIFPLGDLVKHLVPGDVQVRVVLPPGSSPATFEVTPRRILELRDAPLYVMIGGGMDEWTADLPEASGGTGQTIRLSEGVELLGEAEEGGGGHGHQHGTGNPHIWLDPVLVRDRMVPTLATALSRAFPDDSANIRARARILSDYLTALDREIRDALSAVQGEAFITTHAAWSYFALRYGLDEAGVIHPSPGHEPSSRKLAALVDTARARNVRCLFSEPQLGEVAAGAVSSELSLPTLMLDPLGGQDLQGRGGYFELMRFNTRQFADCLGKDVP